MKKLFFLSVLVSLALGLHAQDSTPTVLGSGTTGPNNNITWTRYDNGNLVFVGEGEMSNYETWGDNSDSPWRSISEEDPNPITHITIGEGITSVGGSAFFLMHSVSSVTLANSITEIKIYAFLGTSLSSVSLPSSLRRIEREAFAETNISSVSLPEGLLHLNTDAFHGDPLTSLHIPASVTEIETEIGAPTEDMVSITVDAGNAYYDSRDNCNAIIRKVDNCMILACKKTTIPASVVKLDCAYRGALWLTSLDLSATNITWIRYETFWGTKNLTEVHLPDCMTKLNTWTFGGNGAGGATLSDGDNEGGMEKLERIYIGQHMQDMTDAFVYYCQYNFHDALIPSLTDVYVSAKTPPTLHEKNFENAGGRRSVILHVQPGCVNAYRAAVGWSNFANIVGDYIIIENNEQQYAIQEGVNYTNNQTMSVETLTYTRNFNNTKWQALYVPFAMDFADWDNAGLEVARITNFHQYDRDGDGAADTQECELIKQVAGCSTLASYPYFVRAKEAGEKTITVTNATLYAAEDLAIDCSSVDWDYVFTGNYSSRAMGPGAYEDYTNEFALKNGILQYAEQAVTLNPLRWTLRLHSRQYMSTVPQQIQLRVIGEDAEEDFVEAIDNTNAEFIGAGNIYTLDGRLVKTLTREMSVNDLGLKTGLYFTNGKKVFIP